MHEVKNILITGASSGLGAALALCYAAPEVTLFLSGRNGVRLNEVAEKAKGKGATVCAQILDVTDKAAMTAWIEKCDKQAPLDLVIANAGISAGTGGGDETDAQADAIFAANVGGVMNTIFPVLPLMKARGRGQIALMASLAGFVGLPGAPAYCASKAAVRVYGESLRGELAAYGVKVNVICPGFVKTPMTEVNDFKMPFLMEAEKAAQIICSGLSRNKARISFPWPMAALVKVLAMLPVCVIDAIATRLPRKP